MVALLLHERAKLVAVPLVPDQQLKLFKQLRMFKSVGKVFGSYL